MPRLRRASRRLAPDDVAGRPSRWEALNKPLIVVVLGSVLTAAIGAAGYAAVEWRKARQQCHNEADKIFSDVLPLLNEITGRFRELRHQIDQNPNKGNIEIEKILRGQPGYKTTTYKDQPLNTIIASYNDIAPRKIAAKRFPKIIITGNFQNDLLGQAVANPKGDLTLISLVDHVLVLGNTTLSDGFNRDYALDADRTEAEERLRLVQWGTKVEKCSILTVGEIFLFGYSDRPRLELNWRTLKEAAAPEPTS